MSLTFTLQGSRPLGNGLFQKRWKVALDNAYPVAGYTLTPANLGFSRMELQSSQTAYVDPVVTGVNQSGIMAEVKAMKLLLSYPTGGAGTVPSAANTASKVKTGASTASAVNATTPDINPGPGVAMADATDASTVTVFLSATGYL